MSVPDASNNQKKSRLIPARRRFLGKMAAIPLFGSIGLGSLVEGAGSGNTDTDRKQVRALLISATTLAGHSSLEHAWEELRKLLAGKKRILLINFASLPGDRDAYAARMQRDFSRIDERFKVDSLHRAAKRDAAAMLRDAEAVYVSGGNTFLLLRELYDRYVVELLREKVLGGMPYSGSSAGSNLGGIEIGTTNDFPITDVPTHRALGILPACYNPHHPDLADTSEFGSRQYKIRQYCRYHPSIPVIGVNNAGMISIAGKQLTLLGEKGLATVQLGEGSAQVADRSEGNLSRAISRIRKQGKDTPS